jgi:type I restriction enzyme S subunit
LPGFACGERDAKGVVQLRMNNVDTRGRVVLDDFIRVPADTATVAKYQLKPGDVMFNNTNSTELVGKTALFTGFTESIVFSNHFTRLRVTKGLEPAFLAWWLLQQWQDKVFESLCNRWVGQSAVKNDKLLSLVLPLPPLPEQRRIAGILNGQMQEVEKARKATEAQLEAARALPAAYLREVFDSEGAKKWPRRKLGEVCELNPSRPAGFSRSADAPTTFVPMPAVDDRTGTIAWPEVRPYGKVKKGYTYFGEGDVLFAKITPCMQNGKHAIARGLTEGIGFGSTEFHVLRAGPGVTPEWIRFYIRQPWLLREATRHFTGAVGQQRVPEEFLAGLELPLPSLPEQKRIAGILNEQMAELDKQRAVLEAQWATINKLPAALLRKAFAGEV